MKNESEKLKYQTLHYVHKAPTWGFKWSKIHAMEMRDFHSVRGMSDESIQWN